MSHERTHATRRALTLLLAFLAGGTPALAAEGSLLVKVMDNYGVIPDATVRVVAEGSDVTHRAQTDGAGVARFDALSEGRYDLRASFTGFAEAEIRGVVVAAGEVLQLEIVLSLAALSTSVTVRTPNRREQLLLDVAEPTSVFDEAEVADTGARSAKDLLSEQNGSGIQVNAGGGQGHVSINGISNAGVLLLLNGRRYLGKDANGNLNLEDIQLAGVERIEVVKGAASALYGSDALGGVVNFITHNPDERGAENTLLLSAGSYEDFRVNDTFSWRGSRGGFTATGGWRTYDGFDLQPEDPQTVGQPKSKWWNGSATADLQFSPRIVGRLFADYENREIDPYFFAGATQMGGVYNSIRDLTRHTIAPELEFLLASNATVLLQYNYGKYLRDETQVFVDSGDVSVQPPWREWNQELKLIGRLSWKAGGHEHPLQGGYEFRKEKLERGSLGADAKPERDINVLWLQQELDLGRFTLTGGVRYDDYSDFGSEWSPKVGATFAITPDHRLRASFGQGFRPPYFGQLYLFTPPFFVGNPDLVPEKSDSYSGGYSYASRKVQVSADYYYNQIKDGIVFDLTGFPFTFGNLDRYNSEGVNLSAAVSLPAGFTPSFAYTYNKRVRPAEGGEPEEDIGGYPRSSAFVKLLWQNPRLGLRANVRAQINGEVPPGVVDTSYQPGYQVWYAQVRKTFAMSGGYTFDIFAQVDNIFDKRDIYRRQTCPAGNAPPECVEGQPLTEELLQVWIAPRAFRVGITFGMDRTR